MIREVLAPLPLDCRAAADPEPARARDAPTHGQAGSVDIARRLAEHHYREVFSVLRRLGVRQEALLDATQHVFLVAAEKRQTIRVESERAFVISVAVRTAANLRRAHAAQRVRNADTDVLDAASEVPLADELLDQRRLRSLLDEALDALSPDLRPAFVLFELEDLSLSEIAEALEIPRGTVASRLRRAREIFQDTARRLNAQRGIRGGRP
jgi:RNA polymerase sigma-70 factor (ECF subfamily)